MRRAVAGGVAAAALCGVLAVTSAPVWADGELAVITLSTGDDISRTFKSVNVGDAGSALITPDDCRGEAPTCDLIRVKLNRDPNPKALNFLRLELTWKGGYQSRPLVLPVAGANVPAVNDLDMYVYDEAGKDVKSGGATASHNEVGGVTATGDTYDIVVSEFSGATTGYTLRLVFSNELFERPFELLDPALAPSSGAGAGAAAAAPVDLSGGEGPLASSGGALTAQGSIGGSAPAVVFAPAPAGADADFVGFRSVVNDDLALVGDAASRRRTARPNFADPSPWAVVFWLGLVPVAAIGGIVIGLRRKRSATFALSRETVDRGVPSEWR